MSIYHICTRTQGNKKRALTHTHRHVKDTEIGIDIGCWLNFLEVKLELSTLFKAMFFIASLMKKRKTIG